MYKRNYLVVVINFILFMITTIILKNSIIQFFLLTCLLTINNYPHKLLKKIFIIIAFINIICGKLIFLTSILLFITYIQILLNLYNRKDFINGYILLIGKNPPKKLIKLLYFKEYYFNNYKQIKYISKELGYNKNIGIYVYNIKKSLNKTLKDLDDLIELYKKRFFFNKNKNIDEIDIDRHDFNLIIFNLSLLTLTIILWRYKYALFI